MKSRCYKVKKKDTGEFWSGYSSAFSANGITFNSEGEAGYELRKQLSLRHNSIKDWIEQAEIVEYEITTTEVGASSAMTAVLRHQFYEQVIKKHGKSFVKHYSKLQSDPETRDKYKFAIEVNPTTYTDFRDRLKALGFSSRHYKKLEHWIWIENDEVVATAKMLDGHKQIVDLTALQSEYQNTLQQTHTILK